MNAKKESYAAMIIVLAAICLVTAALLGLVDKVTKPAIEANTAETVQNALTEVLPADSYDQVEFPDGSVTLSNGTNVTVVAVYQAGEEGYVIEVLAPGGYAGDIDMMTGRRGDGHVRDLPRRDLRPGLQGNRPQLAETVRGLHRGRERHQGRRHHQRHHRLHHHLPLRVQRCQRRPCGRGSTGLRREQENEF